MADFKPLKSLPQEITSNIFSRLPLESVLECKLVCRSWRNLIRFHVISTTYFAYQHMLRQHGDGPHGIIQQHRQQHKTFEHYPYGSDSNTMSFVGFDMDAQALCYLEFHDYEEQLNYRVKKMNIKFPEKVCGVCSDNGLICLTVKTKYNGIPSSGNTFVDTPNEPLYICNPITREFVTLPRIMIDEKKSIDGVFIVHGFGYHPLTNEYKVVRISYAGNPKSPSFKGQVEVYTLGSGSGWRSAGETSYYLRRILRYGDGDIEGVCVNGALHWLCDERVDVVDIVAFDLADEQFHVLPTPIRQDNDYYSRIFVMRGCLCLDYFNSIGIMHDKMIVNSMQLCLLKKNNEEEDNSNSLHINDQYYKSWSWNRAFTKQNYEIPFRLEGEDWIGDLHSIFFITKMGEILSTDGREILRYSNQGTETKEVVSKLNDKSSFWNVPLSHINTFVSLEALGERNVKRFAAERCAKPLRKSIDVERPISLEGLGPRETKRLRKSTD